MRAPRGHILIVEDDASFREILSGVLELKGHVVHAVRDGRDALAFLGKQPVDLALIDVVMPRLDGATLVHVMHRDPALRHIPVIALSAAEEIDVPEATLMLQKPVDLSLLETQLHRILSAAETKRASRAQGAR